MTLIRFVMVTAMAAGLAAPPAAAQGYGYGDSCYYGNGFMRCDPGPLTPYGYMGDHKWCLHRDGMLGGTALCSYATYRQCLTGLGYSRGRCMINPDFAEGAAYPPPPPAGARRR